MKAYGKGYYEDHNWELYENIESGYPASIVQEALDNGANPDYVIPGKGESSRNLARRLKKEGTLNSKIAELLKI